MPQGFCACVRVYLCLMCSKFPLLLWVWKTIGDAMSRQNILVSFSVPSEGSVRFINCFIIYFCNETGSCRSSGGLEKLHFQSLSGANIR